MSSLPPEVNANAPQVTPAPLGSGTLIGLIEADVKTGWAKVHVAATAVLQHVQAVAKSSAWLSAAWLAFKAAKAFIVG